MSLPPFLQWAVERFIQTFKKAIRAGGTQGATFHQRLMNFLLVYRSTPHSTTGVAPCILFLNRELRTRFHLLKPDVRDRVMSQQAAQKCQHDRHSRARELCVGQRVLIRNYRPGEDWIPGVITERRGPHSYTVKAANGQVWHRHIDQLKEMKDSPQEISETSTDVDSEVFGTLPTEVPIPPMADTTAEAEETQQPRYPVRNRRPPDRLTY